MGHPLNHSLPMFRMIYRSCGNESGYVVPESKNNRIVMVDDDRDDLFLTKISFRNSPYPVEFVGLNSGAALFEYIKNHGIGSIDVLLLDINMPIQSGPEILSKLSVYPHFEEVKVVMFSTSKKADDRINSLKMGAKDFLIKPSSKSEIAEFVDHIGRLLVSEEIAVAS